MNILDDVLMTPAEVCALAGVTERALTDRRRRRIEPAYIKLAEGTRGLVRYRKSAVETWLRGNAAQKNALPVEPAVPAPAVPENITDDKLLTPRQVADFTGLTIRALAARRTYGMGPEYIKLGGNDKAHVRYRAAVIEQWLRSCQDGTPSVKTGRPIDVPQAEAGLRKLGMEPGSVQEYAALHGPFGPATDVV